MSRTEERKKSVGFVVAEKFFGLILLVLGVLIVYYTHTSLNNIAGVGAKIALFVQFFMYLVSAGLILLGVLLVLVRGS